MSWCKEQNPNNWSCQICEQLCCHPVILRNLKSSVFEFLFFCKGSPGQQRAWTSICFISFQQFFNSWKQNFTHLFLSWRASLQATWKTLTKLHQAQAALEKTAWKEKTKFAWWPWFSCEEPKEQERWFNQLKKRKTEKLARNSPIGSSPTKVQTFPPSMEKSDKVVRWCSIAFGEENRLSFSAVMVKNKAFLWVGRSINAQSRDKKVVWTDQCLCKW